MSCVEDRLVNTEGGDHPNGDDGFRCGCLTALDGSQTCIFYTVFVLNIVTLGMYKCIYEVKPLTNGLHVKELQSARQLASLRMTHGVMRNPG